MNIFARRLSSLSDLQPNDVEALQKACRDVRSYNAGADLVSEGTATDYVHVILSGFGCRYKLTKDGRRQISAYLVPGDSCDLHVPQLERMDHSVAALAPCQVALLTYADIANLLEKYPRVARALRLANLVDLAILREWLLNIGRRLADERIAHLFCELYARLHAVKLVNRNSFGAPISQGLLADSLGLSDVHINRSLRALREQDLLVFRNQEVFIPDVSRLQLFADFDHRYLHLKQFRGARDIGNENRAP